MFHFPNVLASHRFNILFTSFQVYEANERMNQNVLLEPRLSIYGRSAAEWPSLAAWFVDFNVTARDVLYLVQLPRIFPVFVSSKAIGSFAELLINIFAPLFENTLKPEGNPKLAALLRNVVGFDSVDDEGILDGCVSNVVNG